MDRPWRVILVIESNRAYGRGCLRGISDYARTHGPWSFLHIDIGLGDELPKGLAEWNGDGIIARIETPRRARAVGELGLPTVDLRASRLLARAASLNTDPRATAHVAADHFLDRGFRHLAFCGYVGVDFSDQRTLEYTRYLREQSIAPHIFQPRPSRLKMDSIAQEFRGALDHADIARWLLTLPKPVGVMACNDLRGKQVLDACIGAKLRVPEEVAVIGVDNDEVVCELADPPLSSIVPDVVRIGFRGAEMLHEQLRGRKISTRIEHVRPRGIVTRRSSDILAIDDPVVAEAMHLIRERACSEFNVENLLDRMTVSRSTLERRFDEVLGHSPKQEILKVRLARVKQLLQETKYPLWTIAEMTGFKTAAHLSVAFRSHFGGSPGELRAG